MVATIRESNLQSYKHLWTFKKQKFKLDYCAITKSKLGRYIIEAKKLLLQDKLNTNNKKNFIGNFIDKIRLLQSKIITLT